MTSPTSAEGDEATLRFGRRAAMRFVLPTATKQAAEGGLVGSTVQRAERFASGLTQSEPHRRSNGSVGGDGWSATTRIGAGRLVDGRRPRGAAGRSLERAGGRGPGAARPAAGRAVGRRSPDPVTRRPRERGRNDQRARRRADAGRRGSDRPSRADPCRGRPRPGRWRRAGPATDDAGASPAPGQRPGRTGRRAGWPTPSALSGTRRRATGGTPGAALARYRGGAGRGAHRTVDRRCYGGKPGDRSIRMAWGSPQRPLPDGRAEHGRRAASGGEGQRSQPQQCTGDAPQGVA